MNLKKGVFIVSGFLVFAFSLTVLNFVFSTKARNLNLAEKFKITVSDKKLSKAETKGTYRIDRAHSYVGFRVTHMGLAEVPGSFNDFNGKINFDSEKIKNSTVEFTAKVKSVDTRIKGRDNHLRNKDFFEVSKYPEMSFKSTRIKKRGKKYRVYGNLTMKGVTKEVMISTRLYGPIKDQRGNMKMGVQGETTINRRDFNITYGRNLPNGTPMISDIVKIDLQLETVMRGSGGRRGQ